MIYGYVSKTVEQGGWTGVSRFDASLRRVFREMQSVTEVPRDLGSDDLVITDNHLSCEIPPEVRTVVVHHGCAKTHYDRDPAWRSERTAHIVKLQREMLDIPNRTFVAPSRWVAEQFGRPGATVIPHWVERIEPLPKNGRPVIIGDWRDNNKGAGIWRALAERCPQWEFRPLSFCNDAGRRRQYGEASLYLCLSLSEGGSYSMCDAEAAGLPVVTTDVGNYLEFDDAEVIPWDGSGHPPLVIGAIERKMRRGREKPSFYSAYTFEDWAAAWRRVVR